MATMQQLLMMEKNNELDTIQNLPNVLNIYEDRFDANFLPIRKKIMNKNITIMN